MQIDTQSESKLSLTLEVVASDGKSFNYVLESDSSVFVGSSSTCGLKLNGKGVEDIHCMLLLSEGQLKVHGWHTGSTLVNNSPIDEEATLEKGDQLTIGSHQIMVGAQSVAPRLDADEIADTEMTPQPVQRLEQVQLQLQQVTEDIPTVEPKTESAPVQVAETVAAPEPEPVVEAQAEAPVVEDLMMDFSFDPDEEFDQSATDFGSSTGSQADSLLQREVEQLRMELAQRNAEIAELHENGTATVSDDETTERLVHRLEDLLEELENSDRRVLELEQMLRLSDEATQAEREERAQLESWIREIEQRIAQRESESEAQQERLQAKLNETRSQLQQAEDRVERMLKTGVEESGSADDSVVKELQEQNDELKNRLQNLAEESQELRDQLDNSGELANAKREIERLEQQMMQMEVETSRERAEIAREKAVVRRTQDEMEKQIREQAEMSDSDTRLVAMRQHLRERYEKEKAEREERRSRSLGGRISRLLMSGKK